MISTIEIQSSPLPCFPTHLNLAIAFGSSNPGRRKMALRIVPGRERISAIWGIQLLRLPVVVLRLCPAGGRELAQTAIAFPADAEGRKLQPRGCAA